MVLTQAPASSPIVRGIRSVTSSVLHSGLYLSDPRIGRCEDPFIASFTSFPYMLRDSVSHVASYISPDLFMLSPRSINVKKG